MGSLVSGWDSPIYDPSELKFERNKSLTKEEIETFWRSKKKDENKRQEVTKNSEEPEKKYQRTNSLPLTNAKGGFIINLDDDSNLEKLIQKKGLWTKANSAFLNDFPVITSE